MYFLYLELILLYICSHLNNINKKYIFTFINATFTNVLIKCTNKISLCLPNVKNWHFCSSYQQTKFEDLLTSHINKMFTTNPFTCLKCYFMVLILRKYILIKKFNLFIYRKFIFIYKIIFHVTVDFIWYTNKKYGLSILKYLIFYFFKNVFYMYVFLKCCFWHKQLKRIIELRNQNVSF